ncbi:MAG: pyruvate formate-lyase-activating protein, partial [Blautia coccoides]
MKGYIHSLESFGTVDGPGVRYVVFFQGCPMRCLYCHNPDTWKTEEGRLIDTDEIIASVNRNRAFYKTGGLTATGGEPLLQLPFLTELFEKAKAQGIHTCLDTSGITFRGSSPGYLEKLDRLLASTSLIMLDIKHIHSEEHQKLTGHANHNILEFAKYLDKHRIPLWVRHVAVPGITFAPEPLYSLGKFLGSLHNLRAVEVLPYHSMGKVKYENLGLAYPLGETEQLTKEDAQRAYKI